MAGGGSKPGERRGGRQKGTPNKATASMKAAVLAVYEKMQEAEGGDHEHFLQWAQQEPTEFYKIAAKLIPMDVTSNGETIALAATIAERRKRAMND